MLIMRRPKSMWTDVVGCDQRQSHTVCFCFCSKDKGLNISQCSLVYFISMATARQFSCCNIFHTDGIYHYEHMQHLLINSMNNLTTVILPLGLQQLVNLFKCVPSECTHDCSLSVKMAMWSLQRHIIYFNTRKIAHTLTTIL